MIRRARIRAAALLGLFLIGWPSSCSTIERIASLDFVDLPDSRVANLEALHLPSGKHRYTVELQGDWGYVASQQGRRVAGLHIGKPESQKKAGAPRQDVLRNPSETCFEIFNELLDFDSSESPRLRAIQVAWCARLLDKDPAVLTRERAAIGLGELGEGRDVGAPVQLEFSAPRASADDVAELLSQLIASYRRERDGAAGLEQRGVPELAEVIAGIEAETYDLDGARRMLYASASILQGASPERPETAAVAGLVEELERRTIRLALGRAVMDPSGLVRGAGAAAAVRCGDEWVFAQMMSVLSAESDDIGMYRFLAVLLERGFPERSAELDGAAYDAARDGWLDAVLTIAVQHPESHVRTRAMQVLNRVEPEGAGSLREEDWEAWWFERIEARAESAAEASSGETSSGETPSAETPPGGAP